MKVEFGSLYSKVSTFEGGLRVFLTLGVSATLTNAKGWRKETVFGATKRLPDFGSPNPLDFAEGLEEIAKQLRAFRGSEV